MVSAAEALDRLREGNKRFVTGNLNSEILASPARRNTLVGDQKPFAILLGCSDSRVPGEIIFDRGLGDLFVIRVAGNVVAPSQIGSIEYAAEQAYPIIPCNLCGSQKNMQRQVAKDVISEDDYKAAISRIRTTVGVSDFDDVDLAIEAATENEDIKKAIFKELSGIMKPNAIMAIEVRTHDK